jgi:methylmalonyl-CoA/ethylmalonyl-CoA epimerase
MASPTSRADGPADPLGVGIPADLVLGIDHVGVATTDLDRAVAFYADAFGLVEVRRERNEQQQVVEAMLAPAAAVTGIGDEGAAVADPPAQLQILAPTASGSAVARFLDRSGPGLQHLAFRVTDLSMLSALLRTQGRELLYPRPGRGTGGSMINFLHPRDAGGVLVELVQTDGVHAMAEPDFPAVER